MKLRYQHIIQVEFDTTTKRARILKNFTKILDGEYQPPPPPKKEQKQLFPSAEQGEQITF